MAEDLTEFVRKSTKEYLAIIKPKVIALESKSHEHANKDVLDTLTDNQTVIDSKFDGKADLSGGKLLLSQLPDSILGGLTYQGTWDASTATPDNPLKGHYYVVSAAGATEVDGKTDLEIGDFIIYNGEDWGFVDNSEKSAVVAGDDLIAPFTVVDEMQARVDWDSV